MWSSRPLTDCWLEDSGVWTDIPDSHVEVVLANDATSLISYSIVVEASKPQMPGSSFLGEYLHNGGSKDFLQVRRARHRTQCLPDYGSSSTAALLYGSIRTAADSSTNGIISSMCIDSPQWSI